MLPCRETESSPPMSDKDKNSGGVIKAIGLPAKLATARRTKHRPERNNRTPAGANAKIKDPGKH